MQLRGEGSNETLRSSWRCVPLGPTAGTGVLVGCLVAAAECWLSGRIGLGIGVPHVLWAVLLAAVLGGVAGLVAALLVGVVARSDRLPATAAAGAGVAIAMLVAVRAAHAAGLGSLDVWDVLPLLLLPATTLLAAHLRGAGALATAVVAVGVPLGLASSEWYLRLSFLEQSASGWPLRMVVLAIAAALGVSLLSSLPRRGRWALGVGAVIVSGALLALALASAWTAPAAVVDLPPDPAPPRPHVVVVSVDTLRWDSALGRGGGLACATPALDALARESVVFDQAVSQASWTLPSHASLFTGLYPSRHGALRPDTRIRPVVPVLGELFRTMGYETAAFVEGALVAPDYGFGRGFERYKEATHLGRRVVPGTLALISEVAPRVLPLPPERGFERTAHLALRWLAGRRGDRPVLLFVHTMEVHDYYLARPRAWRAVRRAQPALVEGRRVAESLLDKALDLRDTSPGDVELLKALYRAEVESTDGILGGLVGSLRASGFLDHAVLVVVSDHGEGFDLDRGRMHHGGRLHDDQIRVPLLLRLPGGAHAGTRVGRQVEIVDVLPTLLELVGGGPVAGEGRSLAPLLTRGGGEAKDRVAVAEEAAYAWVSGVRVPRPRGTRMVAVRRPSAKLVLDGDTRSFFEIAGDGDETAIGPGDMLPSGRPGRLETAAAGFLDSHPLEPSVRPLDQETLQRLRALGYVP